MSETKGVCRARGAGRIYSQTPFCLTAPHGAKYTLRRGPLQNSRQVALRMNTNESKLKSSIRSHSARLYFMSIRQGARRVLDFLRFGDGTAERLAAAAVLGSLLVLVVLAVSIASAVPITYGLGVAGGVLVVAWATSAFFVFGLSDERLREEVERNRSSLALLREELAEIEEDRQADEEERLAEEDDERSDRRRGRRRAPRLHKCFYCEGLVPVTAIKCRHCGEILDERYRPSKIQTFYPLAAFLSWIFPGLGQMSKGQFGRGLLWIVAELIGYLCCIVPGVVIHVIGIFDAAVYNEV